jgi:glycerophosphoryl diester phosphodiesterase
VHHDYELGRTVNGSGLLSDHILAELRELDAGSWFDSTYAGLQVPLLTEVLDLPFAGGWEIELKGLAPTFAATVVEILEDRGVLARAELTSFHLPLLLQLKKRLPDVRTGMILTPFPPWMSDPLREQLLFSYADAMETDVVHLPIDVISAELVSRMRDRNVSVHAANVNLKHEITRAYELGVDQLSTDRLKDALALRPREE